MRDEERESRRYLIGVAAAVDSPQGCTAVCCRTHRKHDERYYQPRRGYRTSDPANLSLLDHQFSFDTRKAPGRGALYLVFLGSI
jgi:hypothetical protein